jgi:transposase
MGIRASIPVTTGVVRPVELFVAVLGASNYTYVEATDTQRSADFIQSHSHAVEYVGGVPAAIVPDQLRTGIRDPCRYEPFLQRTYEEWAAQHHYYSVPNALIHQQLDIRLSATTVEVFQRGTRVWVHRRSATVGGYTTVPEHMPHAHRAHLEWSPSRLIR